MKKRLFKRRGLPASLVITLIFASMAVALPSFAESYQVNSWVGKVFSAGADTEKSSNPSGAEETASSGNSETAAVAQAQPFLSAAQSCNVLDDFNRADGTNMGANWTEASGDFSILNNRAVGTSGSVMSFAGAAPNDKACVEVYAANSGSQFGGVYLKWTSSGDNLFVKVQDNNGNGDFDRIFFIRDGGFIFNEACQGGFGMSSPFTSARLSVYLDGTTLRADIDTNFDNIPDQSYSCDGAPARGGTRVALGIFGGTALDNFGIPPSTLTVTKTADTNDGVCDADCSLREAIAAAVAGDIIEFASPLFDSPQEIQLSGQLLINKNLTINGKGAKLLTLRQMSAGSRNIQILNVTTVNLSGMTITGSNIGFANGAGILAGSPVQPNPTLNFSGLNITGNSCGAGGCGISTGNYNLNLSGSTVSNNSSGYCCGQGGPGGIQFQGTNTFNLINSTVSGNTAGNNNSTAGGGIWFIGSTLNVINSTITDNGANGGSSGVNVGSGTMTVRNSIIAGNRNNSVTPDVTGSVVSNGNNIIGNAPGTGFTDGVNNDRVGNSTTPFNPLLGTLADNGGSTPTHALLSNSQAINNGNDCVTDLSCSANNPPFALTTDQRGLPRNGQTDIGSFEFQPPPDSTPPVITPTVTGTLGNNGWYVSDVQVSWSVVDNESPISNQTGCDAQNVTTDTNAVTFTCSATSAGGTDSYSVTIKRDATAPTVQLTSAAPNPTDAAFTVTAQFSEPVTSFDLSDITVTNGSATDLTGSGSDYAFTVTPAAPGAVSAQIQANTAQDEAGNNNTASNQLTRQFNNLSTLIVTKTADTNDGVCDADCSLREAISAATAGNTINFASPLFDSPQTININGQLEIDKSLTINGRGANLTTVRNVAAASGTSRVIRHLSGTVTLSGMTFTGGNLNTEGTPACGTIACGGGIYANGSPNSSLTIINSVITGNNSNSGNSAQGGGVFNEGGSDGSGTLTIIGSTISNNTASSNVSVGGGIHNQRGTLFVVNSTVSGNSVIGGTISRGGGVSLNFGTQTIINTTITNNSSNINQGGIGSVTSARMRNTIVSGNTAPSSPDVSGTPNVNENNLIGGDARLLPLGNYGGATPTHALLPDSPAINAGNDCVLDASCASANPPFALTTDQRGTGFPRKVGTSVDIGAFEFVPSDTTPPVITPTITGTLGSNGWYVSDVQVSWSVTDDESTISSQTGCATQNVIADTSGVTFTCSAQSDGGSNSQSVTIKRDASAPTITFASRTAPNSVGWNNSNVAVEWTCADNLSGAVSSSVTTIISTEGANQSALGICTDNAGNTASDTQTGINIDKTAPNITFDSRTPAANADGWNNTDVTVNWTCSDTVSGVVNSAISQSVSSEGVNLSSTGTCFDLAGNSAQNTQSGINIDKTAPVITFDSRTAPNANGWNNTDVSLQWNCADALSGAVNPAVNQIVGTEGANQSAMGTCQDLAGNTAQNTQSGINIDKTAPSINFVSRTPPANQAGWNNTDVTIGWSCSDTVSGVVNPTVNQTVSSEGANQSAMGTCIDLAGNSVSDTQTGINIDKTAPSITLDSRTPPANAAGWNNTDVTVNWNCADALSGAVDSAVNQTVSTEGTNQTATGVCVDLAGNSAQNTQTGINIDKTAPVITLDSRTAPNANGWNNTNVALVWNCADTLSGAVNPTVSQTVSTEGANQSAGGTCTDNAGNTAQNTQSGINIDKTAPTITFVSRTAPNANGWNNANVIVNWNCTDALSGAVNESVSQTVSSEGMNLSSTGTCVDLAGNSAQNTQSGINIDKTAPTATFASRIPPPNANGWNNTNVVINWNCTDALSGAVNPTVSQTVSSEGANQTATGTCFDLAGNSAQNTQTGISIDKTPPVIDPLENITVSLPPNSNAVTVAVTFALPTASDNFGPVSVMTNPVSGAQFPVGTTTVQVTATDQAGNQSVSSFTVTVLYRFNFTSFSDLLVPNSLPNQATAGSDVRIDFSLSGFKGANPYSQPPSSQQINCVTGAMLGASQPIQTRGGAVNYNAMFNFYSTTWITQAAWRGTCRRLTLSLNDGTTRSLDFFFR